jgi:putative oxidoreductase
VGFLGPYQEWVYAALRIMTGLLFVQHGLQKLFGAFGGVPAEAPAFVVYGAGAIELAGGALVAIGLFAGPAAFLSSGTMAVAYFMAHFPRGFFPILNEGELAILYCFVFLYVAARGSGALSVDAARGAAQGGLS